MGSKPFAIRFGLTRSTQGSQIGSRLPVTALHEGTRIGLYENTLPHPMHGLMAVTYPISISPFSERLDQRLGDGASAFVLLPEVRLLFPVQVRAVEPEHSHHAVRQRDLGSRNRRAAVDALAVPRLV